MVAPDSTSASAAEPGAGEPVRGVDQLRLEAAAEEQPVQADRRDDQHGGERGEDDEHQVHVALVVVEVREPGLERAASAGSP